MTTIFQCPVCQHPLTKDAKMYHCENGHVFDRAKEGYINLLLANQKKSKDPGDSRAMMRSRKAFLERGYYQLLAEHVASSITEIHPTQDFILFDAGCGEGYYTDYLQQNTSAIVYGIDISKDAVRYASKVNKQLNCAVASVHNLPVMDQSVDIVLSIFSPRDPSEIHRVLKPDGALLTVTPAPAHLLQLRQMIYDTIRPYDLLPLDAFAPQFKQSSTQQVTYDVQLTTPEDILNLLQMTPFYWHIPQEKQESLHTVQTLNLRIAFEVSVWKRL